VRASTRKWHARAANYVSIFHKRGAAAASEYLARFHRKGKLTVPLAQALSADMRKRGVIKETA
jgi:hypothetical protein